jgi:hypothetical protein
MSEPILIAILIRDSVIERISSAGVPVEYITVERDVADHPDCDHVILGGELSCVARAMACNAPTDNRLVMDARAAAIQAERMADILAPAAAGWEI